MNVHLESTALGFKSRRLMASKRTGAEPGPSLRRSQCLHGDVALRERVNGHAPWSPRTRRALVPWRATSRSRNSRDWPTNTIRSFARTTASAIVSTGRVSPGLASAHDSRIPHGVAGLAWTTSESSGHFARAVLSYLWNQVENGTGCPTGMAYAACAGFAGRPEFALWREKTCPGSMIRAVCRSHKKPAP